MNHLPEIYKFMVDNFLFGDGGQLRDDTSFLEEGIVDSTGILELVTFLENTYGITIEDDELIPENLDSLKNVTAYVERKLNGVPVAEEEAR